MIDLTARLTHTQRGGVLAGSGVNWRGGRESGTSGNTMQALERRGLAEVRWQRKPYRRQVYRLTAAGEKLKNALQRQQMVEEILHDLEKPVEHEPVRVRCTHCGAEFPDGTPGGSCGRCGLEVVECS